MTCELCESDGGALVWRGEQCRVVHVGEPGYTGYCRVIWNAHVREMTDLTDSERAHCMGVVFALETALRELLRPHKVNLASLGNITDHLHWHVIARFHDDPHFPNAVWSAPLRDAAAPAKLHSDFTRTLAATLSRHTWKS
jgi:diadenosine tetraphosphate (Ap4A) HIT family hydrolase